ncbi:hypothetical protein [Saccharolobus caldissimus]|uniref:Uncharacterized protein n=1 Tax=Saccharolobus caldissimus TaxID=1702097 RepID=A0AAQ4CTV7_9CREN|nr:hypothetical protein [Saccharolobus caldissimus]BDB99238.1 hypothetical protein SACC_22550 [Saccharolobus caldissimus]
MIGCKDLQCVINTLNSLLKKYGISKHVDDIMLEQIRELSIYNNNKVFINVLKYEEIANEAAGESEILSSFLLLLSLYSLVGIEKTREIIQNEYGKESPIFKLYEILF